MTSGPVADVPPRTPAVVALLRSWDETEHLDPAELERRQMKALEHLLDHARATVPYYADRVGDYPPGPLDPGRWKDLPVLGRAGIQAAGSSLDSTSVPPDHGATTEMRTSGSTGRPVRILTTGLAGLFWRAITLRDHEWHRRDLNGRLAAIRADIAGAVPYEGAMSDNWGVATAGVYDTGPAGLFSVCRDVAAQARWLVDQDPDYLLSYPSNLEALALYFLAEGRRLPRLRQVRALGETLGPALRDRCRQAWGVEVVDVYSARDTGYLALQCPASTAYHVQAETVYLEVLDDRGRDCGPGEIGRVVVTPLHNYATPLLRYEIGDFAEVGRPCDCGRGLPTLARVLGRVRNMWTIPGGGRIWPLFSAYHWGHIDALRQLQLVQHDLDHVEARVVGPRPLEAGEEIELERALRRAMEIQGYDHPFHLAFTYVDHIDRSGSGKFEDFVSYA